MIKTTKGYGKRELMGRELIFRDHNHRLRQNENKLGHIIDGDNPIGEVGLRNPLTVISRMIDGKNAYEIVRGHTRWNAISWLQETNPVAYAEHFAKGIPVEILPAGLPESEIETIRQDQGESQDLSHRAEFITACVEKMRHNESEHKILRDLYRFFVRFGQQNADKDSEYDKLILAGETKAAQDLIHTRFHGAYQKIARFYTSPPIMLAMLRAQAEGRNLEPHEIPAWYPEKTGDKSLFIPVWRDKYSKSLDDKWRNEQKVMDANGLLPKYNKANPGPEFIAYCAALIQEIQESEGKESEKVVSDKSLSSKVLQDLAKECGSVLMKNIMLYAAGKSVPNFSIQAADSFILTCETLRDEKMNVNLLLNKVQNSLPEMLDVNEMTVMQIGELLKENLKNVMNVETVSTETVETV